MKQLECNVLYDKEVGPVTVKCTLLTDFIVERAVKKGSKVAIVKEESEEFGIKYSIWDLKDWQKLEKNS